MTQAFFIRRFEESGTKCAMHFNGRANDLTG